MSYPRGARSSVCYGYEPWHYRYYGRAIAAAIHASRLTPRVWLWRHGDNPGAIGNPAPPTTTRPPGVSPSPSPSPSASPSPTESASFSASPVPPAP